MDRKHIGFIGAGNMASAIMNGIQGSQLKKTVKICAYDTDAEKLKKVCAKYVVKQSASSVELVKNCGIILLAVKPQSLAEALASLKGSVTKDHLIITIVAGVPIAAVQSMLGVKCSVVRVMPNTPALIGEGAAGYSFSPEVNADDRKTAEKILSTFCKVMVNFPEDKLNAVTALSGSGPAYVFYFAEAMMDAAAELGIDANKAKELIAQTFIGSAKLMTGSDESPEELRIKVTSKGGTTQKALETMEAGNVRSVLKKALIDAKIRADELGR